LPIIAARDRQSAGRIPRGAVLAPEVELIARRQHGTEEIEDAHAFGGSVASLARGRCAEIDRRQQGGSGNAQLGIRFLDSSHGRGQIVVGASRLIDQIVEPGGAETMPPIGLGPSGLIRCGRRIARAGGRIPDTG